MIQVAVAVALDYGQALGEAGGHARGADLQPLTIDPLFPRQQFQEFAVLATDIQHPGAGSDKPQDLSKIFAHAGP